MKLARVKVEGQVAFAVVDGEDVRELAGHPFEPVSYSGRTWQLENVRLLAPVLPSKIVAVAKNYSDHAAEMNSEVSAQPMVFLEPSTSVIGPDDAIVIPPQSQRVDHEAELAVVIGRLCRDVPVDRVRDVILGYTCANDVTARDLQAADGQWSRAKGFDTFCPLGPWIETSVGLTGPKPDVDDLAITCEVNGELRQAGRTASMVHSVSQLVAFVSSVMTLLPGDLLLTGTPAGISPLAAGDQVDITIERIGTLTNKVVAGA